MPGSNCHSNRRCNSSPSPALLAQCHLPGTDRSTAEGRLSPPSCESPETHSSWCSPSMQESLGYQSSRPCPASHSLSSLEAKGGDAEWLWTSQCCPCWEWGRKEGTRNKRSCIPLRTAQIAQFCTSWIHRYCNTADQLLQVPHAPDLFHI